MTFTKINESVRLELTLERIHMFQDMINKYELFKNLFNERETDLIIDMLPMIIDDYYKKNMKSWLTSKFAIASLTRYYHLIYNHQKKLDKGKLEAYKIARSFALNM